MSNMEFKMGEAPAAGKVFAGLMGYVQYVAKLEAVIEAVKLYLDAPMSQYKAELQDALENLEAHDGNSEIFEEIDDA